MDLLLRTFLNLLYVAPLCRNEGSSLALVPLPEIMADMFPAHSPEPAAIATAIDSVVDGSVTAQQDKAIAEIVRRFDNDVLVRVGGMLRLAQLNERLEELRALDVALRSPLFDHIVLTCSSAMFDFLRYLVFEDKDTGLVVILVGRGPRTEELLKVPLPAINNFSRFLTINYRRASSYPRISWELYWNKNKFHMEPLADYVQAESTDTVELWNVNMRPIFRIQSEPLTGFNREIGRYSIAIPEHAHTRLQVTTIKNLTISGQIVLVKVN